MVQLLYGISVLSKVFALSSFWAIYRVYEDNGIVGAIVAVVLFSLIYAWGPAPMFAAAATMLHFKYNALPLWVAVASYIWAVFTLGLQLLLPFLAARARPTPQDEPTPE